MEEKKLKKEVDADVATQETRARVLKSSLEGLPPLSSKIVRIFTSSTFTDTQNERNTLMSTTYSKLKEYCREKHGLEFQVVDMRWGVRDEATEDHKTTELCMTEIANCQRLSVGPNFVAFLGQKYGYRPLPTVIMGSEHEMLREVIEEDPDDLELLDKWYVEDTNHVPPVYILQPISVHLPHFNNKRMQRLMERDKNAWWEIMLRLQTMLRKAANVLFMARKISRDDMHNYFMSVTEREVRSGIINCPNPKDHCLAYLRTITNMKLSPSRIARNFIDLLDRDLDDEASRLLDVLRDQILPTKLEESNATRFEIEWSGRKGIDTESHCEYLKDLCDLFHDQIIEQVDRAVEANTNLSGDRTYSEVLQHLHSCETLCRTFQGRDEAVEDIKHYLMDDNQRPLVLIGQSGCGKTSLIAKGFTRVVEWFKAEKAVEVVVVLRFIGTTPDSSGIIPMMTSLCNQICFNYDLPTNDIPEKVLPLVRYFKTLLAVATVEKPLVVFLDSLDQISSTDGAHSLTWLPVTLPDHCKLVVSTSSDYTCTLDTLKALIEPEKNYIEIKALGPNLGSSILQVWLKNSNRTVTPRQWIIVQEALKKCNLPLFVKLVFDEISKWTSYSNTRQTLLAHSIHDSIFNLFEGIEKVHGQILVSRMLAYVTASKSGLSESELEDLLSLDEKVLNDVYQYHLPPIRRIPPLLCTRIRSDLSNYFSEREADGLTVINWHHLQFIEASRARYFRNVTFVEEIHSMLCDYYLGIWGDGVQKPFEYSDLQTLRFSFLSSEGCSDRKVPPMPYYYTHPGGRIIRCNLRKLNELPYSLIRAKRFEDLYREVLFKYRFLHAKLSCQPLLALLADFEDAMAFQKDHEVKLLADALRLSASILSRDPDMIGPQIVGRLLPYYNTNEKIRSLIDQCDTDGLEVNALSPSFHCMHTPGGPLQFSLEGHPTAPFGIGITSDCKYLISVSNLFIIYDLATGDVYRQFNAPGIQGIMQSLCISPDDKYCVSHTSSNQIFILSVNTGEMKTCSLPAGSDKDQITGSETNTTHTIVWTDQEWFLYTLGGEFVQKDRLKDESGFIIWIGLSSHNDERFMVWKKDNTESDEQMTLNVHNTEMENFVFNRALVLTGDKCTLFACISDDAVVCYKRNQDDNRWQQDRNFESNYDKIVCLTLSHCEHYLVADHALGYKLWDLRTQDACLNLALPTGLRNIPHKNKLFGNIVFTQNSQYVVAGVRKNLYVWNVKDGEMVKILDAHFGRVVNIQSVIDNVDIVVSSSIDRSIKVWNFENVRRDVFTIDRMDRPIEELSLSAKTSVAAITTRGCVGIWNLESGVLIKQLANSAHSSIVTHSAITSNGLHVVSAESGNILLWDVKTEQVLKEDPQNDVQQLFIADGDSKSMVFSKGMIGSGRCVCRGIPRGEIIYQFDYSMNAFINAVLTSDGMFLCVPAVNPKGIGIISMYHARTGTSLYDVTTQYHNLMNVRTLVSIPSHPHHVALIDDDKGNIYDMRKKVFVRSIQRWNGRITTNGQYGLVAPNCGGLELIDLLEGKTVHTLIPRTNEGVFSTITLFTKNDQHVVYYHSVRRSICVFRVADGDRIAEYRAHAEIKAIASTQSGMSIVVGAVDGSVIVLSIADPIKEANTVYLASLPSRQLHHDTSVRQGRQQSSSVDQKNAGNTEVKVKGKPLQTATTLGAVVQIVRGVSKAKRAQKTRTCVLF